MRRWNNYNEKDLTMVICTYKECPYLEASVRSIMTQTKMPHVIISTSTPNEYVKGIAKKYNIEMQINPNGGQINDYNFAMQLGNTPLIMIAHQDEIMGKHFVERSIQELNRTRDPIISFTNYLEMHDGIADAKPSMLVKIKRMMLFPARWRRLAGTRFGKWLICAFGDPINHPTVICVREKMPDVVFREEYKASMDWDLWERIYRQKGTFTYVNDVLMLHRMDESNQTNILLKTTNERYENEYDIFCRFWPKPIAMLLMKLYSKAYNYY